MTDRIFIFCDDPSHPRPAAVTNFEARTSPHGDRVWVEVPASRADRHRIGTGTTIVADALPAPGWALNSNVSNADVRSRFELVCRRCRHPRPVPARSEHLYPVLDGWLDVGVSKQPLAVLATSLQEQSRRQKPTDCP